MEARMKGRAPDRVRRVSVTDPIAAAHRYDYADAFELRLERPDRCSPEQWVRAGVDATPAWIKRIAGEAPGAIKPKDGTYLGALFESLVTLSVRVYAQAAQARVHHFRTHRGEHEVDLVVEGRNNKVLAIEVKLAATPPSDAVEQLDWFAKKFGDDVADRIIITSGHDAYRRPDGIAVIPAALLGA
jgi:hypothetical protein